MIFSKTYKKYAWELFANNYIKNNQLYVSEYYKVLNKHGKLELGDNGEVLLDRNDAQNSMRNFAVHTGEFSKYLQVVSKNVLDTANSGIFDSDGFTLLNEVFKESDALFTNNNFELNAAAFRNKNVDYWVCENGDIKVGYSLPDIINPISGRERLAAMFTDYVVAYDVVDFFLEYQQIKDIYKDYSNMNFSTDIYKFALMVYDAIKMQSSPYVTGKIIETWKLKGLCSNCGGTYKGLINKKCSICGATKK